MLRIDLDARQITASVGSLVEDPLDVPRPAGVLAEARAALGSDIHRRYREEAEAEIEGFQAEVPVSMAHWVDGFGVRVRGRVDGLIRASDRRLRVEEVKSVGVSLDDLSKLSPRELADARLQVRLYALCLARAHPAAEIRTRVVLVSVVDGARRDLDVAFDADRVLARLDAILRRRIALAHRAAERRRDRAQVASALRFPYEEPRPYQQDLSDEVSSGLEAGRPVLAMAPTGIGKTVSVLLPALRFALSRNAVLYFLTAKTTQQALVAETFCDLARTTGRPPGTLQALTFREKRGMCPAGTLLCHPEHCAHLARFLERRVREAVLDDLIEGTTHHHPDAIYREGDEQTVCPYGLALALCLRVDLVIGDYNYVYDPAVSLSLFAEGESSRGVVAIVDEAHNLFDRAREYYSPFVPRADVETAAIDVRRDLAHGSRDAETATTLPGLGSPPPGPALLAEIEEHLDCLAEAIDRAIAAVDREERPIVQGCAVASGRAFALDTLAAEATRLMVRYAHFRQAHGLLRLDDPLIDLLQRVGQVQSLLAAEEKEFVPYVAVGPDAPEGAGLGVLCVDPAKKLEERHRQIRGTVAMSATLTPLDYYADVLGFRPLDPRAVAFPSPFPEEHRCVALVPTVGTTWRERRHYYDKIARTIEDVIAVKPGNYVAYFPSFRFLEDVRKRMRPIGVQLLVQGPRMPSEARRRVLEALREGPAPHLLLAVMGGVFAEGIDLPGDALIGAIVVGPGLPQVGFERAVMRHYFDETVERGFAFSMLYPGMQRVIQSAGRVHRTPDDRGVIVLLDRRFARTPYVDCLPSHWVRYGPEAIVTRDPASTLEAFWGRVDAADASRRQGG